MASVAVLAYAQISIFLIFIVWANSIDLERSKIKNLFFIFKRSVALSILIISLFSMAQYFEFVSRGTIELTELTGEYLIYGNSYILRQIEFGSFRAISFYFEPSFFCLVLWTLLVIYFLLQGRNLFIYSIVVISAILSQSALGIAFISLTVFVILTPSRIIFSWIFILVILLVIFSGLGFFTQQFRFYELGESGTSGFYRFVVPFIVSEKILFHDLYAVPFGGISDYVMSFSLDNGDRLGATIDNSYFLPIMHYSWVGVFLVIGWIYYCVKGLFVNFLKKNKYLFVVYFFIGFSPFFTGAVFSFEVLVLYVFLIIGFKFYKLHHGI
nr:hypothetical protein [uncultured Albidiferax sp.]